MDCLFSGCSIPFKAQELLVKFLESPITVFEILTAEGETKSFCDQGILYGTGQEISPTACVTCKKLVKDNICNLINDSVGVSRINTLIVFDSELGCCRLLNQGINGVKIVRDKETVYDTLALGPKDDGTRYDDNQCIFRNDLISVKGLSFILNSFTLSSVIWIFNEIKKTFSVKYVFVKLSKNW